MPLIYGIVNIMKNQQIEQKSKKSTLLLVLFLFVLFNAVQLFRTSINTMFFTEDISGDYATVEATVVEFKPEKTEKAEQVLKLIPVFSFLYKDEVEVIEAPDFAFNRDKKMDQPFQQGEKYTLWVHKRWGKLMVPPIMGPEKLGRLQMKISAIFLLLAVAVWILRNRLAKKI
jgi:hypothetical protein